MSGYEETMSAICKTLIEMNAFGLKTKILLHKTWQISYNSMTPSDRSEHKHTGSDDKSTQTDTAQNDSQLVFVPNLLYETGKVRQLSCFVLWNYGGGSKG